MHTRGGRTLPATEYTRILKHTALNPMFSTSLLQGGEGSVIALKVATEGYAQLVEHRREWAAKKREEEEASFKYR